MFLSWLQGRKDFSTGTDLHIMTCSPAADLIMNLVLPFSAMTSLSQTKELFRRADAVCFDVDSTVIKEEGIDELAKFCGVGDAVREMYA